MGLPPTPSRTQKTSMKVGLARLGHLSRLCRRLMACPCRKIEASSPSVSIHPLTRVVTSPTSAALVPAWKALQKRLLSGATAQRHERMCLTEAGRVAPRPPAQGAVRVADRVERHSDRAVSVAGTLLGCRAREPLGKCPRRCAARGWHPQPARRRAPRCRAGLGRRPCLARRDGRKGR